MAVFRVERPWCDLEMSEADIDAAGYRALACLHAFPELRWLRSYYDPERRSSHCYYETDRPEQIREHAGAARIPCGAITRVLEITAAMWAGIDRRVLKARAGETPGTASAGV